MRLLVFFLSIKTNKSFRAAGFFTKFSVCHPFFRLLLKTTQIGVLTALSLAILVQSSAALVGEGGDLNLIQSNWTGGGDTTRGTISSVDYEIVTTVGYIGGDTVLSTATQETAFTGFSATLNAPFPDTYKLLEITAPATGHETKVATIVISGTSVLSISDSIIAVVDGVEVDTSTTDTSGSWTISSVLLNGTDDDLMVKIRDKQTGEIRAQDTITVTYDGIAPKVTAIADTSVKNGSNKGQVAATATFYIVDTGAGFNGTGSCTLYWHFDSGTNINFTAVEPSGSPGTYVIEGTIPNPGVDTKVGFWWGCHDDALNIMTASSLTPKYLESDPGTYTIKAPAAASGNMIADTLVIYGIIDSFDATTSIEGVILYNPTDRAFDLNGYSIQGSNENDASGYVTFASGDTIAAFGYFLVTSSAATDADKTMPDEITDPAGDSVAIHTATGARVDLVGNGAATEYEGTAPTAMATSNDALIRKPSYNFVGHGLRPAGGGGGMIDTDNNASNLMDDTTQNGNVAWPNRNKGITDRLVFACTAPTTAAQSANFGLSCTAVVRWKDVTSPDSVARAYTGSSAWGTITSDAGTVNGLGADSSFTNGVLNNYQLNISATLGTVRITIADAYCTGYVDVYINASTNDTVTFDVASSGATHETTAASATLSGNTAAASGDSVQIYIDNVATDSHVLTANGVWSIVNVDFKDKTGESVAAYAFDGGVFLGADTITVHYDATKPRITKIGDTTIADGGTTAASETMFFYVFDTGTGFNSAGGCTLYWHVDSGANTNWAVATENDSGGTATIEAMIPVSTFNPLVDTKVGFWWVCRDDLGNLMDSASLSPSYTDARPGTFTVDVASVRDVIISEIMWDGDNSQGDMEYVELYNRTGASVSLNGWRLRDGHGTGSTGFDLRFGAADSIPAYSYYVIYQTGDGDIGGAAFTDISSHFDTTHNDWDGDNDLLRAGDSLTLFINSTGVEIDSAPFLTGWPAGGWTGTNDTNGVSMERKMSGLNYATVGSGDSEAQWDSHNMRHGNGRPHGTPGHVNSINIPSLTSITPRSPVASSGRGKWTLTVTNGRDDFSGGRVVLKVPAGWSQPTSTANDPGYTTVSVSNGTINTTTFSGDSMIVDLTAWTAQSGTLEIIYGDNAGGRNSLARVASTSSATPVEFQLFYDTSGSVVTMAGDSGVFGVKSETLPVVEYAAANLLGGAIDTNPSGNPRSFMNSEYTLTITHTDTLGRVIYGAHDSVTIKPFLTSATAASDSHVHEDATFAGFYDPTNNDTIQVGGWTDEYGRFQATLHVSSIAGNDAQLNEFRVSWGDNNNSSTVSDSARLPVPVINEVAWDGSVEYIEVYNPTHQVQTLTGFQIISVSNLTDSATATIEVGASGGFNSVFSLNPFHYVVFVDTAGTAPDSGGQTTDSREIDAVTLTDNPAETLVLRNASASFTDMMGILGNSGYFNDADKSGGPDEGVSYSLERVFTNRSGNQSDNWASSDSAPGGTGGAGTSGRPNAKSLYATQVDRLDTVIGRPNGSTMDTARVTLILKIASGDTQPNQQIGVQGAIAEGPRHGDSSWYLVTPSVTNSQGTAAITISANGNNTSGTVHIRIRQPYGVTDSAYIVFDRGESFAYIFQSSETNISDTSAKNALVVFVSFKDTISGIDTSIMPQYRWKVGVSGTYTSYANMTYHTGDTYLARIDISPDTWSKTPHDTIYWQYLWRDRAGNWDTSPTDDSRTADYIDNTKAFDTISSPSAGDTLSGSNALVRLLIGDGARDYCTITVKYDTYASGLWTNATLVSGSDTKTNLRTTQGGDTLDLRWNTTTDLSGTTIVSVRLRVEIYDGFDTRTDTTSNFGIANATGANDPPSDTIALPADGETYAGSVTVRFFLVDPDNQYCTVSIRYAKDSGTAWFPATITGSTSNLYAPSAGDTFTVTWNSKTDLVDTKIASVKLSVTPSDGTDTGPADTTLVFGIDNQKPGVIDTVTAAADVEGSDTGVYVSWSTSSASDSKGYNIYRFSGTDSAQSSKVNVGVITDTFGFKDSSAVQGDTNFYYVVVVDTYDNQSDSSMSAEAPNIDVVKDVGDSSNAKRLRPGDTVSFLITVRNNGFAPARGIVLYDYVPQFSTYTESAAATSLESNWTIEYRVDGAGGSDVWQSALSDTATMLRFTRSARLEPKVATASDTLRIKVKIQ